MKRRAEAIRISTTSAAMSAGVTIAPRRLAVEARSRRPLVVSRPAGAPERRGLGCRGRIRTFGLLIQGQVPCRLAIRERLDSRQVCRVAVFGMRPMPIPTRVGIPFERPNESVAPSGRRESNAACLVGSIGRRKEPLGRATAKALAEAGLAVAIAGRRADVCETSASQLRDEVVGATVSAYQADVADPNAVEQLVAAVIKDLGGLDVLVAAAGVYENVSYLDMTADLWDRTMNVVLRGAMLCSVAAAEHMRGPGGGRRVLLSP